MQIFTGLRYLDTEILKYVDNDDLKTVCELDSQLNELYEHDDLWKRKLEIKYGEDILFYVKNNFRDRYKFLSTYGTSISVANTAAENNYLEILKWLYDKKNSFVDHNGEVSIVENNNLEILEWVHGTKIIPPNQFAANLASEYGYLDILKLLGKNGGFPTNYGVNVASAKGYLNILKYLGKFNIYPNNLGINLTVRNDHLHILKWLEKKNILPDDWVATYSF